MNGRVLEDWERVDAALSEMGYPGMVEAPREDWATSWCVAIHWRPDLLWKAREVAQVKNPVCFSCWDEGRIAQEPRAHLCEAIERFEQDCGVER